MAKKTVKKPPAGPGRAKEVCAPPPKKKAAKKR
jgi:hypothetical protein